MGYFVGKMISEMEGLLESVPSLRELWKTKRDHIELKWDFKTDKIWFKFGKNVLMRVDKRAVFKILRFHEMDHVEGGGIFTCAKTLKEIHDEIVYKDKAYVEGSEEFYFVSLCQFYYDVSPSRVERLSKYGSYMCFKRRSEVKRGRKVGVDYSLGAHKLTDDEREEMIERAEYNMKVGRLRRIYPVFEDGYREKCIASNIKFDRHECLETWVEMDKKERENW